MKRGFINTSLLQGSGDDFRPQRGFKGAEPPCSRRSRKLGAKRLTRGEAANSERSDQLAAKPQKKVLKYSTKSGIIKSDIIKAKGGAEMSRFEGK